MSDIATPPGQPALRRRVRTHPETLANLRAALADQGAGLVRGLASVDAAEPAIALLDAFAVVSDIVAFYSERLADEAYLRTATERRSIRELARTLDSQPRPGMSAEVDLVFTVAAPVVPATPADPPTPIPTTAVVPAGTPVQSIPGPGELPQTFETTAELTAHVGWNEIPLIATEPQQLAVGAQEIWFSERLPSLRPGDGLLVVGDERRKLKGEGAQEKWDFRTIAAVTVDLDGYPGWTVVELNRPLGYTKDCPLTAADGQRVFRLTERGQLFGATAPDPALLAGPTRATTPNRLLLRSTAVALSAFPPGSVRKDGKLVWDGYKVAPQPVELDGDHKSVLADSWIVLQDSDNVEAYRVTKVDAGGAAKWGISGKLTRLTLDIADNLDKFDRRSALVHSVSVELPTARRPRKDAKLGATLALEPVDPPLVAGQRIVVEGVGQDGQRRAHVRTVLAVTAGGVVSLDQEIDDTEYRANTVVVRGNVAAATHGETVRHVLGSGDGRTPFRTFPLRRAPLTHVRATTPAGAEPALTVTVDGVPWRRVDGFVTAGPDDRVYWLVQTEPAVDGGDDVPTQVVFGDGVHGAVPPSGTENIVAEYRVGIGDPGRVDAGRLTLLPRKPHGVAGVVNPLATRDAAPADDTDEVRRSAPLGVRVLGRIVSVSDAADFARGFAGVGHARADAVWNGRESITVVTITATGGAPATDTLLGAVADAADRARDTTRPLIVLAAQPLWFGVRVGLALAPDAVTEDVFAAVTTALRTEWGPGAKGLAEPATASAVLLTVCGVAGVRSCTMPQLVPVRHPMTAPPPGPVAAFLPAFGAHWDAGLRAAQHLTLGSAAIELWRIP